MQATALLDQPHRPRLAAVLLVAAIALAACGGGAISRPSPEHRSQTPSTVASAEPGARTAAIRSQVIGFSVRHRAIVAVALGRPGATRPVLVIGDIHGNEPAGIAIARWLIRRGRLDEPPLWVIPDLNPDGVAAGTRQNAHGVDLNRNFPYRWTALYGRGDLQYQGPRPLSEPESRAAYRLILRLRPRLTIWFHQPQGLVDLSGGDPQLERRFAALAGLPVRELTRYPGSAPTWQNHALPGSTAFVVELPPGQLGPAAVRRLAHAVLSVARSRTR